MVACLEAGQGLLGRVVAPVPVEGAGDGVEELDVVERFEEEIDGAVFHGADASGDIAVAGDEDEGQRGALFAQARLEVEAGEARHPEVEDEASGAGVEATVGEETCGRRERLGVVAGGFEQAGQAASDRVVVIDDEDGGGGWVHGGGDRGRVKWRRAPPEGRFSAAMRP